MKFKNIILGLGLSLLMNTTFAQGGLEGIVVERYYQTNDADGTNASANSAINALTTGTVVYRVYVDMATGYKFSQLYGSSTHDFKLNTTTNFYNDPNNGTTTNPASISLTNAKKNTVLIDSWFTTGGVCAGKSGVLKSEDVDGTIGNTQGVLANNPGSCYGAPINGTNAQDGLVSSTSLTSVNPNILGITSTQLNLLDQGTGNSFLSNNGAIAALGGIKGSNASNMVLVGQFTTNGVLSFEFNVQIISANGTAENWVARNRTGSEYTSPSLIYNSNAVAGTLSIASTTICSGDGNVLTLTGANGDIQWQVSTTSGTAGFSDVAGATLATQNISNITTTRWYRAKVSRSSCNVVYSNAKKVTIAAPAVGGTLSASSTTLCKGSNTNLTLSGSSGTIKWYKSTNYLDANPTWLLVTGTSNTLNTGVLNASTAFKAKLTSYPCSIYSNEIVIEVVPTALSKTITSTTTAGNTLGTALCTNDLTKTLVIGSGYRGEIQWQSSMTSATTGFTDIIGANSQTYVITSPTAGKTWYRARFYNSCFEAFNLAFAVNYKACGAKSIESSFDNSFGAIAYPNPFADNFMLEVNASTDEMIQVNVYDMLGKLVENQQVNVSDLSTFEIGNRFVSGVYNIEVIQGTQIERLRVVKN